MLKKNIKTKIFIIRCLILTTFFLNGCKKFVDVGPPSTKTTNSVVYNSDQASISVIIGIYAKLSEVSYSSNASISSFSLFGGLSADEFTLYPGVSEDRKAYYKNQLNTNTAGPELWNDLYPFIFSCNSAIIGMSSSNNLTPSVKTQLLGEAEFLRAFFYFYLVNVYGDVPIVLSDDYTSAASIPRSPMSAVYQQVISDLLDAQAKLNSNYVEADAVTFYPVSAMQKIRPNQSSATALLARTYLYTQKWDSAELQATKVINNTVLYSLDSLENVFLANSKEAIWQWQPVTEGVITNTPDAVTFNLSVSPEGLNSTHPVYLNQNLINSFESGDLRFLSSNWVNIYSNSSGDYYYANKYKDATAGIGIVPTEYKTILRLGEQYLIRAEARARQNNIIGAQDDLNIIRRRAGLIKTSANDQQALVNAIIHEKQIELFSEWGHRWLDLKRTGLIDSVMSIITPQKANGAVWQSYQKLYPLPVSDILRDPSLIQNPGY